MFILILSYLKPIEEVDKYLQAHKDYLDSKYKSGEIIVSGRKNPRTGGIIICRGTNREEVQKLVDEDPFSIHQVTAYDIIEFEPTSYADGFEKFI